MGILTYWYDPPEVDRNACSTGPMASAAALSWNEMNVSEGSHDFVLL
jgi:hypothetical protein